ncbi:hypothetical protein BGZ57DRAFT_921073 [Hyaloscypha finlandica]|nr:hypothetical protein BGZ57DRAFT_921073 [Hyaloscypha finlandica]
MDEPSPLNSRMIAMLEEGQRPTPEDWHAFVYQRVPSLYGPGNFACWVLIVASVFVTWTLNRKQRRSDVLGADFMAMITYPIIAALDAATKLARYPFKRGEFHKFITTMTRTSRYRQEPEEWLYTEAIRAPMAICVRFCEFGAVLLIAMAFWKKPRTNQEMPLKRGLLLSIVWNLCAAVKLAEIHVGPMFTKGKGPPPGLLWTFNRYYPSLSKDHVDLATRQFILLVFILLAQFLACSVYAFLALVSRIRIVTKMRPLLDRDQTDDDRVQAYGQNMLDLSEAWGLFMVVILSIGRLATYIMGDRQYVPQTTTSMNELDQVAALLGGVVVLVWSLKDAAMEWKGTKQD